MITINVFITHYYLHYLIIYLLDNSKIFYVEKIQWAG
jgi:hypothetical protein